MGTNYSGKSNRYLYLIIRLGVSLMVTELTLTIFALDTCQNKNIVTRGTHYLDKYLFESRVFFRILLSKKHYNKKKD